MRGHGWMRLSALRLPRLFPRDGKNFCGCVVVSKPRTRARRENASSLRAPAKQSSSGAQLLDCFVAELVIGPATSARPVAPRNERRRKARKLHERLDAGLGAAEHQRVDV